MLIAHFMQIKTFKFNLPGNSILQSEIMIFIHLFIHNLMQIFNIFQLFEKLFRCTYQILYISKFLTDELFYEKLNIDDESGISFIYCKVD